MSQDQPPILETIDLTKAFGRFIANDRVSLQVHAGQVHALLGENGAGKSTLVKSIFGVHRPDSGTILWRGRPVEITSPARARDLGIGMVFQHFSLFDALTVAENIAVALPKALSVRRVAEGLARVSARYGLPLRADASVADLSAGERQRVEIVRCLMQNPDLIIMDEPTSVLTPQEAEDLLVCHPDVADCAVFGVPDEEMGEAVKAVVQLSDASAASDDKAAELIGWLRERLSHIKAPRSIDFREDLPRTATGKLMKRLLKDEYWAEARKKQGVNA